MRTRKAKDSEHGEGDDAGRGQPGEGGGWHGVTSAETFQRELERPSAGQAEREGPQAENAGAEPVPLACEQAGHSDECGDQHKEGD